MSSMRTLSPSRLTLAAALSLIDCVPSQVAILDEEGRILAVNGAWRTDHGASDEIGVGADFLSACEGAAAEDEEAARFAAGLKQVVRGELNCFEQGSHGRVTRLVDPQVTYLMVTAA
jgi:PAS domain-containing protein